MFNKERILLLLLFVTLVFFRFYDLEGRTEFRWDQVDNAWVAKDIIVDHRLPLLGMQAKQNTGFFIGPAYYYFIAPFYWVFNLDPIASGVIASVTSIITFFVLFYVTKKIFSFHFALLALFLYVFSFEVIFQDRFQWPINFISPVSLIIFYALYNVLLGKEKYLMLLALALGFSFHLNFTSVLFPIIILFSLPFFPRTKKTLKYILISIPIFLVWLIPNSISELNSKASSTRNMANYLDTYYHGVHLRRILQLAKEAFIEFETVIPITFLKPLKYFYLPLFYLLYFLTNPKKEKLLFSYLVGLWILVPWMVFSTYSGEITNYYFSLTRPIVIMVVAYLVFRLLQLKYLFVKIIASLFLIYYGVFNTQKFLAKDIQGLDYHREKVKKASQEGQVIEFQQGVPESYIYYIYTRK